MYHSITTVGQWVTGGHPSPGWATPPPPHIGHIFMDTATDLHAVCIFPFRVYELRGMILYAKSSLELIVNNRIGKVGIQLGPSHTRTPPVPPFILPLPHGTTSHLQLETLYTGSSVHPYVSPVSSFRVLVFLHHTRYAREYDICSRWRYLLLYPRVTYVRIITYKRVILSYTSSLVNDN